MLIATILASAVLVLFFLLPYYILHLSRGSRLTSNLRGPKPLPILGNVLEMGYTPVDILKNMERLWKQYGFLFKGWAGPILFIFLADPKYAEHILSSSVNIRKNICYKFMEPWLGTGLLTSAGNKWRHHRKMITPSYHFKILEQFIDIFNANGNILIKKLKDKDGVSEFNIYKYINIYALDVICEAALGVQMNVQSDENSEYLHAVQRMSEILMQRIIRPWIYPEFLFNFSSYGKEQKKYVKILHDMSYKIIGNRKMELLREGNEANNEAQENDLGQKRRLAFLDLLLQYSKDGGNLTDEEIREEVDTFMFEGHDTTASGISFCLWLLANNSHCQEKAYEELNEIFGDSERETTAEDLKNLKYLECVIKETLRLYPSVPIFFRELVEDIQTDGLHVVAGQTMMIAPFFMHRHPDHFPDPEKFDPDRFTAENSRNRHPYAYVPFSAGPRNCIGQKFAMMEMKAVVSKILRNYKLSPGTTDTVLSYEVILRSQDGIFLKIESRQ